MKKGEKMSDKIKREVSKNRKGKCLGNQFAKGNKPNKTSFKKGENLGNQSAKGNKPNQTSFKKGEHRSIATEFKKGIVPKNKGVRTVVIKCKICNGEVLDNRSKICRKCFVGENHCQWRGGKSFEPYTTDWTKTLKRSIRERDKYTCWVCDKLQTEEVFCVHHIDYNKENCNPDNLITLCRSCHIKTNHNREYWINYFNNIQKV